MRLLMIAFMSLFLAFAAEAEKRAFIVGVGEYDALSDLRKTVGDANGYRALFGDELNYKVTTVPGNKSQLDFITAFDQFHRSIAPGDEVVFVFSGHGWSDGAENYLSFSDAPTGVSEEVRRFKTVALKQYVMSRLRARDPKMLLAIIDACRDEDYSPLTKSNSTLEKGIVRISANEGELILYSAAQGQTSLDRLSNSDPSQYSVFTRVLLPRLRDTSRPLSRIADETRAEVQRLAGTISHTQRPEMMLGIDLDYCLSGACNSGVTRTVVAPPPAVDPAAEAAAWAKAEADGSVPAYLTYLSAFPTGKNAETARTLITMKSGFVTRTVENLERQGVDVTRPTYAPGDWFRDCDNCPIMIVVPAGEFIMGSPEDEEGRRNNEGPQRRVAILEPFAVGKFEVTWDEWEACVSDGGCSDNFNKKYKSSASERFAGDAGFGRGIRPVINVSLNDAHAFVVWLSRKTGREYSLLSEAQWEYAARAGTNGSFSNDGDERNLCEIANNADSESSFIGRNMFCRDGYASQTAPAGSFKPNAFGLYDMHGNVSELVEDCWHYDYEGAPIDGTAWTNNSSTCYFVSRGGSWGSLTADLRSAARKQITPEWRYTNQGFRIARTLP